jgi:hypothetical protein
MTSIYNYVDKNGMWNGFETLYEMLQEDPETIYEHIDEIKKDFPDLYDELYKNGYV